MEELIQNCEKARKIFGRYNSNFVIPEEGDKCREAIKTIYEEDFSDDLFERDYKDPYHYYLAALVRRAINIAEDGRKILSTVPRNQIIVGTNGPNLVIFESNPEIIKGPFILSPPTGPQDTDLINGRFQTLKRCIKENLSTILQDKLKRDEINSNFSRALVTSEYLTLSEDIGEEDFINAYLFVYRETGWAAAVAEYFAESLANVIFRSGSFPRHYFYPITDELSWLPNSVEAVSNFKLGSEREIELRQYLQEYQIKENDLIFFHPHNTKQPIMVYFMGSELHNNFRGFNRDAYLPKHFYEFMGRMGLTRRVTETLYSLGHIIRPEPGYWPPQVGLKRLV